MPLVRGILQISWDSALNVGLLMSILIPRQGEMVALPISKEQNLRTRGLLLRARVWAVGWAAGTQFRQGVYISREDRPNIELADGVCASREVWETALRHCVLSGSPNVRLVRSTAVKNLLYSPNHLRVTGEDPRRRPPPPPPPPSRVLPFPFATLVSCSYARLFIFREIDLMSCRMKNLLEVTS